MDYTKASDIITAHAERVKNSRGVVATEGNPTAKKLKHRTWLEQDKDSSGGYHLRYFNTKILTFYPLHIEINDGGFFSSSTHQRLNEFMPQGFRVSGCTYPALHLGRPLGFLRTPKGTFPWRTPCSFCYDGRPYDDSDVAAGIEIGAAVMTPNAGIVTDVPQYVDAYLDQLLSGKPCNITSANEANWFWQPLTKDGLVIEGLASRNAAVAVYAGRTYTHLAALATREMLPAPAALCDLSMPDICLMLETRGAEIFRKPKTRNDTARRLEDVLFFEQGIPNIPLPRLRKALRQPLIDFIVHSLGFEEVAWNRRDR